MVSSVSSSGPSSSAALTLLHALEAASESNEKFLASDSPTMTASVSQGLSARSLFSILTTVAAAKSNLVVGAEMTATVTTSNAELVGVDPSTSATVTTADVQKDANYTVTPGSQADIILQFVSKFTKDNALSSDQISKTLLSGGAIGTSSWLMPMDETLSDAFTRLRDSSESAAKLASDTATWLASGRPDDTIGRSFAQKSDEEVSDFVTNLKLQAENELKEANSVESAYKEHTLALEKASDVNDLKYTESIWMNAVGGGGSAGGSVSYNRDFVLHNVDGKQHNIFRVGLVSIYASW